jgi:hypothetical protein
MQLRVPRPAMLRVALGNPVSFHWSAPDISLHAQRAARS